MQTLRGLVVECGILRTNASCLQASVVALSPEKKTLAMLTQNVRDFGTSFKKIRADVEVLRKQNMELAGEIR